MDALDDDMLEPERAAALHEGQARPLVEASVGSPQRKLDYVFLGETSLAADRFGFAGPRPPAEDILRDAARIWSRMQEPTFHLGTFSSPRLAPDDFWVTTARCHQHTLCHSGHGSVFQFRGKWHDRSAIFLLDARQAGRCREGDQRVVRAAAAAVRKSEHEISVQERASILTARDELLEKTLRPTAHQPIRKSPHG